MTDEIQLISDGDGLAVIGDPAAVELFLEYEGLTSRGPDLTRVRSSVGSAGAVLQGAAEIAENSGRWVKLTKESAGLIKKYDLMKGSTSDTVRAVVVEKGQSGIKSLVEFTRAPGGLMNLLTNPAALSSIGGIMAQVAMQQQMEEITAYLAVIDERLDDVLRAQKDEVLSELDGVALALDEAQVIRGAVGRVSETTWSKVQASSGTIATLQARALRELDAVANKVEKAAALGDKAKAAANAESRTPEWLAVLARTFQLQEAISVLELDRVLEESPEELERHRLGLQAARQRRIETIAASTAGVIERMVTVGDFANSQALAHPRRAVAVVGSRNRVVADVIELHGRLGIDQGHESLQATRWREALVAVADKAVATGTQGIEVARRTGTRTAGRATAALRSGGSAADEAGSAIKGAARKVGGLLSRKQGDEAP